MKEIISKEAIIAAISSCSVTLFGAYLTGKSAFSVHHYNAVKNVLFSNITFMGDSIFAFAAAGLLLFFFNKKDAGMRLLVAAIITLLITQVIKNLFSGGLPAQIFFEDNAYYFDDPAGIPASIISSHTAIAFTLAAFFSSVSKNKMAGILLFAGAIVVAYSRIYTAHESISALAFGLVPAAVAAFAAEGILKQKSRVKMLKDRNYQKSSSESLTWY